MFWTRLKGAYKKGRMMQSKIKSYQKPEVSKGSKSPSWISCCEYRLIVWSKCEAHINIWMILQNLIKYIIS